MTCRRAPGRSGEVHSRRPQPCTWRRHPRCLPFGRCLWEPVWRQLCSLFLGASRAMLPSCLPTRIPRSGERPEMAVKALDNPPRIGVVVPTWNSARTLDWTLLSLTSQRGCQVEVIVADSGSTDGTLAICRRWGVNSIYVAPGNMYRAVNAGLQVLEEPWLTYLNSDDIVYPDSYGRLAEHGAACGADIVYGCADYIDGAGRFRFAFKPAAASSLPALLRRGVMGFAHPAAIFRRELFAELRGFAEQFTNIADFEFFQRAGQLGRTFTELDSPSVAAFRLHPGQLSQRSAEVVRSEMRLLLGGSAPRGSGVD